MNPEPPTTQRKARRITTGERIGLFPEIVEVEPVVRRGAAIMLEPLHIGGQGLLRGMAAPIRRRIRPIGQALEMDVVAPAAAIEGTHQDNGAPQPRRRRPGTGILPRPTGGVSARPVPDCRHAAAPHCPDVCPLSRRPKGMISTSCRALIAL